MQIVVVGTGYVGLVTGTCFAEVGNHVTCIDINESKITGLQEGKIPIFEPGLEEKIKRNVEAGRLEFTCDYGAVEGASLIFLALPTPPDETGACDLSYLEKGVREVIRHLSDSAVIINKSTAPVGTAATIKGFVNEELLRRVTPIEVDVVANPEFLKQGNAVQDFMRPDRIVIGADSTRAAALVREVYSPFSVNHDRILLMDSRSAEMTKYASNAMLATRISFMNELANLCEHTGADITKVRLGLGADNRIGYHFLYAGIGYGGSCFPKDLKALEAMGAQNGCPMSILEAVEAVNERQKRRLSQKINTYFSPLGGLKGKTLAIWGLSFKPDTDDLRSAPSLALIDDLLAADVRLRLYDPIAMDKASGYIANRDQVTWCASEEESATGSDAVVLVTEWKQFRFLDMRRILDLMRGHVFFDGRNQYKPQEMAAIGFDYVAIGQPIQHRLGSLAREEKVCEKATAGLSS